MSSSSVANAAASSGSGLGAIQNQSQFNTSYTQFLTMLTTELQNQDPTSPMDATDFTNQLVGFSQLEQQLQMNGNLQTLVADQQSGGLGADIGYLGHTVMATGDSFALSGDGAANVNYSLPSTAASAVMTVTNGAGQTVATVAVPTTSGMNTVSFNGDDDNGDALPAGNYTFAVTAADSTGAAITATTYSSGTVTGLDSTSGTPVLHLGGLTVNASDVVEVVS